MKITQKKGSKTQEFELINDSELLIKEKSFLNSKEWTVDIESIGHHKIVEEHSRNGLRIVGSCFILIALTSWIVFFVEDNLNGEFDGLIWGGLFSVLLGITCFKAPLNNFLILNGGYSNLKFFLDSPSREEVEAFADKLIVVSKNKIREKYSRIDSDLPEDTFMNQLNWLLNSKLINEEEYNEKKREYKISKLIK
ncbi:hypothetical protein [Formosa algae]|uniref:Uncharacterized protein n=1 Tax=Formosa algae TaxID=225843 RepID=A0A9X0YNR6_9FLAO|nr:hypothetical protein [Formosa algae]MBP1840263.1 hypothetical protein [Formosa algae]MDQ0334127.1 hypothetical protein [Formosa algae]OEI79452.1 hypothetical protein AST99_14665 [Formosa algae]